MLARQARERQACGQGGVLLRENLPQASQEGKVRDLIVQDAGVSGNTVDKFKYINKTALSTKQLRAHDVWV